jgi:hypothetical protein
MRLRVCLTLTDVGATMREAMLDARVDRLEATPERLANAQAQTQAGLRTLVVTVNKLADAVADLKGDQLERQYREQRSSLAADARDAGRLSAERLTIFQDRT